MISDDRAINSFAASLTSEFRLKLPIPRSSKIIFSSTDPWYKTLHLFLYGILLVFICSGSPDSLDNEDVVDDGDGDNGNDPFCLMTETPEAATTTPMAFLAFLCLIPHALHKDYTPNILIILHCCKSEQHMN